MTALKFYLDTHIDKQVAVQLKARGVEIIRAEDVGLKKADDETHLIYAAEHDLILVTKDQGFRDRHFRWLSEGKHHAGILYHSKRHIAAIGEIVSVCHEFAMLVINGAGSAHDFADQFIDID